MIRKRNGSSVTHGVTAVAELKHDNPVPIRPVGTGHPRRHRRGRIEARGMLPPSIAR